MPATPSRIGFITHEFRMAVATDTSVKTRHGNQARATEDPMPTYFDDTSDASVVAGARQDLLGTERRRFRPTVVGAADALALDFTGSIPVVHYTDAERGADLSMIVAEITIDLGRNVSTLMLWG